MIAVALGALFASSIPTPIAHSQQVDEKLARLQLTARIETVIAERTLLLYGARIGIAAVDLSTGEEIYARGADQGLNVASNVKLFTASAALALLGPDFSFQTAVYGKAPDETGTIAGDIVLRGRADPALGLADLRALARDLWLSGVRKIRGGVVVDDTYFDGADLPPHFGEKPDDVSAYRAPIGALAVGFNQYTLQIAPPLSGSGPARIAIDPPNAYIKLEGAVETVASGRTRIEITTKQKRDQLEVKVVGQIRADEPERRYKRRIPDGGLFAGALFSRALAQEGIALGNRKVRKGKVPPRAASLATTTSLALAEQVRGLGKYSNNFMAEMLLKTIGAETREDKTTPATWDDGLRAVRRYLVDQIGLSDGSFTYENGSGLFDSNRFTARQIARLLRVVYDDFRYGPDMVASLSISGADGTLRSRMGDGPAARQIRAKTGTLDRVSALSGYAATNSRAPIAFSILVNGFPDDNADAARSLQDDISAAVIDYLESVR